MGWKIFQQPINNLLDKVRKILEFGFKAHCSMNRASTKAILAFCLFVPVSNSVCAIFPPKIFHSMMEDVNLTFLVSTQQCTME